MRDCTEQETAKWKKQRRITTAQRGLEGIQTIINSLIDHSRRRREKYCMLKSVLLSPGLLRNTEFILNPGTRRDPSHL